MSKSNEQQTSFKDSIITYFKGIRTEWGKITWPEKKQVVVETIYVVVICFIFTVFILLMDLAYKGIFSVFHLNS